MSKRFRIEDRIDACRVDGASIKLRELEDIERLMLHRIVPNDEAIGVPDEAVAVGKWFWETLKWTHPYTFYVRRSGLIEQTRPVLEVSPHAFRKNRSCLAIGVSGDHRQEPPTSQQVEAVRWLVRWLSLWLLPHVPVVGHDEVEGASSDPDKVCPGQYLLASDVRRVVEHDMKAEARHVLRGAGLRLL